MISMLSFNKELNITLILILLAFFVSIFSKVNSQGAIACSENCSGHGSCNILTGECICDTGYSGADCSQCDTRITGLKTDFSAGCLTCDNENKIKPTCTECYGNWEPTDDCASCIEHYDISTSCETCLPNYDINNDCQTCLGWFDSSRGCGVCINNNFEDTENCTKCKKNYDINTGCETCLARWDSASKSCSSCRFPYMPGPQNDCELIQCRSASDATKKTNCNGNGTCNLEYGVCVCTGGKILDNFKSDCSCVNDRLLQGSGCASCSDVTRDPSNQCLTCTDYKLLPTEDSDNCKFCIQGKSFKAPGCTECIDSEYNPLLNCEGCMDAGADPSASCTECFDKRYGTKTDGKLICGACINPHYNEQEMCEVCRDSDFWPGVGSDLTEQKLCFFCKQDSENYQSNKLDFKPKWDISSDTERHCKTCSNANFGTDSGCSNCINNFFSDSSTCTTCKNNNVTSCSDKFIRSINCCNCRWNNMDSSSPSYCAYCNINLVNKNNTKSSDYFLCTDTDTYSSLKDVMSVNADDLEIIMHWSDSYNSSQHYIGWVAKTDVECFAKKQQGNCNKKSKNLSWQWFYGYTPDIDNYKQCVDRKFAAKNLLTLNPNLKCKWYTNKTGSSFESGDTHGCGVKGLHSWTQYLKVKYLVSDACSENKNITYYDNALLSNQEICSESSYMKFCDTGFTQCSDGKYPTVDEIDAFMKTQTYNDSNIIQKICPDCMRSSYIFIPIRDVDSTSQDFFSSSFYILQYNDNRWDKIDTPSEWQKLKTMMGSNMTAPPDPLKDKTIDILKLCFSPNL